MKLTVTALTCIKNIKETTGFPASFILGVLYPKVEAIFLILAWISAGASTKVIQYRNCFIMWSRGWKQNTIKIKKFKTNVAWLVHGADNNIYRNYSFGDSLPVEVSLDLGIFQNYSAGIDTYNRGYTNIYKVLQI